MKFDDHLRKSQLIVPFGPGALYTLTDGVNCIVSGLDDWFKEWCPKKKNFSDTQLSYTDLSERGVIIEDDRLTKHLNIGHIYSVPSKEFELSADENWERKLRIPFFVFPSWWYCRNCGHMVRKEGSPPNKCDHIPSSKATSHTTNNARHTRMYKCHLRSHVKMAIFQIFLGSNGFIVQQNSTLLQNVENL